MKQDQEGLRSAESEPRIPLADIAKLSEAFWAAPLEQRLFQEEVAPILRRSKTWLEKARVAGIGPKFQKEGRAVYYLKRDVVEYLSKQQSVSSTAEYPRAA
jgi:hypothetical protein